MRAITAVMLVLSFAILAVEPAWPRRRRRPTARRSASRQAKKVLAGAEAEAKKNNWNVVIYVLDSGGQPVAMQRLDGAQWGSVDGGARQGLFGPSRSGGRARPSRMLSVRAVRTSGS